jgi:zinc/manganese transport system substrate-binding protein
VRLARRAFAALLLVGVAAALGTGCGDGTDRSDRAGVEPSDERPQVAVTTNILADVTRAIAAEHVDVIDLMPRGADPHSYGLSAAQTDRVARADLVLTNGLGLEEGIIKVIRRATDGGVRVVELGPTLDPLPFARDVTAGGASFDPHVWTDPSRMAIATRRIATELAALLDDDARAAVAAAAEAYVAELDRLDAEIESAVAALPRERRKLVTNHHVLGYFAERYGFEVLGAVIPSGTTLASPSARDLAQLADMIRRAGVGAIFAETSQPDRLVQVLADEVGVKVKVAALHSESLGPPGGPAGTYLDMMRSNASTIVEALRTDP